MKLTSLTMTMILTALVGCNEGLRGRSINPSTTATPNVEADETIRSSIHRERGSTALSYLEEIRLATSDVLPETVYRSVPDMEIDDEGTDGKNVSTQTSLGRPQTVCGNGGVFSNVGARIADCLAKNGTKALWSGRNNGANGEGDWKLVSKNDAGEEIWQDDRTKMIWSDVITLDGKSTFNWCQAAGNDQSATETSTIDCNTVAGGISACHNLVMDGLSAQIKWRLPTRNDFLQADLDGLRFVLPLSTTSGHWTATMKANTVGRTEAWVYYGTGILGTGNLTSERQVRCIGAPNL